MAKIVVYNDEDPAIGIVLIQRSSGWRGECTECGCPIFRRDRDKAVAGAQAHVDSHDG